MNEYIGPTFNEQYFISNYYTSDDQILPAMIVTKPMAEGNHWSIKAYESLGFKRDKIHFYMSTTPILLCSEQAWLPI